MLLMFLECYPRTTDLYQGGDSDSDEPSGPRVRAQRGADASKEELDDSNLISAEDASRHFRRAERRRAFFSLIMYTVHLDTDI